MDKLSNYLLKVNFSELDAQKRPLYPAKEVIDNMKKIGPLLESFNKIEEQVNKEQAKKVEKVRGDAQFNIFEE